MILREGATMLAAVSASAAARARDREGRRSMLYEVSALDPIAFTIAPLCCARDCSRRGFRAPRTRISPMAALRTNDTTTPHASSS
jgi:hypothetical protein